MTQDVIRPSECSMWIWEKVYSAGFGWSALKTLIDSIWSIVSFQAYDPLFISYLKVLSTGVSGVLKSPAITVLLSISPFMTITFALFPGNFLGKESACSAGDPGSIPGSGRSPGEGIGCPPQYSWASLVAQLVENPSAMRET